MTQLIFDESSMINGNIFKFEQRLHTHLNKYIENGALLVKYFAQDGNAVTVDRGTQDIDQLFGKMSPLRFIKIINFPLYGFGQTNPENTDEMQIEDINVEGDCIIVPSTLVPKQYDCFIINHLKMKAVFMVTNVTYDSMKVDGFYKIHYRLWSTSDETIQNLEMQTIHTRYTDLNAIGSNMNPIINEDDYVYREKVIMMMNKMIKSYRSLFYNSRHNCFLFHHPELGLNVFDMCGNEFMSKYSLMNPDNCTSVIALGDRLSDKNLEYYYNNSVHAWLEMDCPSRLLQQFYYQLIYAEGYPYSSFTRWGEGDTQIMLPMTIKEVGSNNKDYCIFDTDQLNAFLDKNNEPCNEYDKLIWKYIYKSDTLNVHDVSLFTADALISSERHIDVFVYTPLIVYIIRRIIKTN